MHFVAIRMGKGRQSAQTSCKERKEIREKKKARNTLAWATLRVMSHHLNEIVRRFRPACIERIIANNHPGIEQPEHSGLLP